MLGLELTTKLNWYINLQTASINMNKPTLPPPSDFEMSIMFGKGTEPPFSGSLLKNELDGAYLCRACAQPLFNSFAKFDSGTGWPSFDQAIPGAVLQQPDPDGMRTEITCARCGAHLGHVFSGEGFTDSNLRYCTNSASLFFVSEDEEMPEVTDEYRKTPGA